MDDRDCLGQPAAGLLVQHRKRHREVGLVLVPAVLGLGKQHDLRPQVRDAVQDGGHGLPVRAPDRTRRAHHPARRPHALRLRTSSIACGTSLKLSALPTPRPPETTMDASVSSGRAPFDSATRSTTRARVSRSDSVTGTGSTAGVTGAGVGVTELGRTVTSGRPRVTRDLTIVEPANTTWVAAPSASTATASTSRPLSSLTASRPAISLPSWVEGSRTAAGAVARTSSASTVAFGATRCP